MDRNSEERLSALLDAELPETGQRQYLSQLIKDDVARETFARYRLIGEIMRSDRDSPSLLKPDFAKAVAARLAQEPAILAPPRRKAAIPQRWLKAASGVAIAATVAMLAIQWGPRYFPAGETPAAVPLTVAAAPSSRIEGARWETANPELERKLNRYLVSHGEYAAGNGMNQVLPYASFVTYDAGR